jgi:hypothetical protein
VGLLLAGIASVLVIGLNRTTRRLDVYFPELRKIPGLSRVLRSDHG